MNLKLSEFVGSLKFKKNLRHKTLLLQNILLTAKIKTVFSIYIFMFSWHKSTSFYLEGWNTNDNFG